MGSKLAADYDDSGYCSLSGSTARVQDALRVLTDKSIRVLSQGVNDYAFSQVTDVVSWIATPPNTPLPITRFPFCRWC